jgi:hypothetical protein
MSSDVATALFLVHVANIMIDTVGTSVIIFGTVGNLCNCFAFLCIPALRKHPNALFVVAAAIGSLVFIDTSLLQAVVRSFSGTDLMTINFVWCKLSYWISYTAGSFSYMCGIFLALEQYLLTLTRIKWHRLITRNRARYMIVSALLIWLLIFLPLVIFYTHIRMSPTTVTCTGFFPVIVFYGTYWLIVGFYFLPMIVITIFSSLTWYNLKQLRRRHRALDAAVTRMMLIQTCVLLANGIPGSIFYCYSLATKNVTKTLLRTIYEDLIFVVLTLATFFTNSSAFWVYLIASATFRKHIKAFVFQHRMFNRQVVPFAIGTAGRNTIR